MSLFRVKDWDVPSEPVLANPETSRKRKRLAGKPGNDESAQINIHRLMQIVDKGDLEAKRPKKAKKQGRKHPNNHEVVTSDTAGSIHAKSTKLSTKVPISSAVTVSSKQTKNKSPHLASANDIGPRKSMKHANRKVGVVGLTSLQSNMKDSLVGARFRWINEVLYTTNSAEGYKMIQNDPNIFEEYHLGFRQQVLSWPHNPVNHYISVLTSYPKGTVIADLGCGDAALARTLVSKGYTVLSYDLIPTGPYVLEADVCRQIPLPGSEDSNEGQIVDVCICALSLMSLDWIGCIRESWRVLKLRGELKIAEVASRFVDINKFVDIVCDLGFILKSKDDSNTHFTLFEFQKINRTTLTPQKWDQLRSQYEVLKPCEYKRR